VILTHSASKRRAFLAFPTLSSHLSFPDLCSDDKAKITQLMKELSEAHQAAASATERCAKTSAHWPAPFVEVNVSHVTRFLFVISLKY
jgi:hypothetical protein